MADYKSSLIGHAGEAVKMRKLDFHSPKAPWSIAPLARTSSPSGAPRLALCLSGKNATHTFGGNPL